MSYKENKMAFKLDTSDLAPIAQEYASSIGGTPKSTMNGYPAYLRCRCPGCKKDIAALFASKGIDNWILGCPNKQCNYSRSMFKSISESGDEHLKNKMVQLYNQKRDENYTWWYEKRYGWKPIKSRNCRTYHKVDNL